MPVNFRLVEPDSRRSGLQYLPKYRMRPLARDLALVDIFRRWGHEIDPNDEIDENNWGFYLYPFEFGDIEQSIHGFRRNQATIYFPRRRTQDVSNTAHSCKICKPFLLAALRHDRKSPESPILAPQPGLNVNYAEAEKLQFIDITLYSSESDDSQFESISSIQLYRANGTTQMIITYRTTTDFVLDPKLDLILPAASTASGLWSLLNRCITKCLDSHSICHQDYDEDFLPTRLIDIGPDQCPRIKVVNTIDIPRTSQEPMRYITLSHRWGKSKFFTLEVSNLLQCSHQIDLNDLPQTFKDTIAVSRRLGYRYVWIDSLCIIQDSIADMGKGSIKDGSGVSEFYLQYSGFRIGWT